MIRSGPSSNFREINAEFQAVKENREPSKQLEITGLRLESKVREKEGARWVSSTGVYYPSTSSV